MSYICFVLALDGTRLMPIKNPRRVRRLLSSGKAVIVRKSNPFVIQLTYESEKNVQPIEFKMDTGDTYIGISICSEKHEYISEERKLLPDEKEHHDDARKYRRNRRGRKKYRQCRASSHRKDKGTLAPSIQNKLNQHILLFERYHEFCPITDVTVEVGSFDTQLLEALERGIPVPEGEDYQKGPRYKLATLRDAVFFRDNYTCQCCGSKIGLRKMPDGTFKKADVIFKVHHIGFRTGDHSDRMGNLLTVCERCHTSKNHKPGGLLYDLKSEIKPLKGAAFMNTVRWRIKEAFESFSDVEVHVTYGSATKVQRTKLNLPKSHANDAYSMGKYHPKHRTETKYYKKIRRNNRCLEKFYDATYIDIRDGKKKKASELGCNRTNRSIPRNNPNNERIYRGKKISNGYRSIRRKRYDISSGCIVLYEGKKYVTGGSQHYGEYVVLKGFGKSVKASKIQKVLYHPNGWVQNTK